MKKSIIIVDYGAGNLGSVLKLFSEFGLSCEIASTPEAVLGADLVVLPGQGAIGVAMRALQATGLDAALKSHISQGRGLLGICLGMQLLMGYSEEDGGCDGLGVLAGTVKKFTADLGVKIPHMGWNTLDIHQDKFGFFEGVALPAYAYFAHSFYVTELAPEYVVSTTGHGVDFVSVLAKDRVFGLQSHPEKSGAVGIQLIRNYLKKWGYDAR